MSVNYDFSQARVTVKFKDEKDLDKRAGAFTKEVEETDQRYAEGLCDSFLGAYIQVDYDKLEGQVFIERGDEYCDTDLLAEVICKHFPTANGYIGWSNAEVSGGGFVRFADGGHLEIRDGKIEPSAEDKILDLRTDIRDLLDYIKTILGKEKATNSGIKHLFKKYEHSMRRK